jgi:hypothetical protein
MQQWRALRSCGEGIGRLHEARDAAVLSCLAASKLEGCGRLGALRGEDAPAKVAHLRHDKVYIDSSAQRNDPAQP